VLADIYGIAYRKDGLDVNAEEPLCLTYGALAVRELLRTIDRTLVLDAVGPVGVAVGHDAGDFVLLGRFVEDGLAPIDPDSAPVGEPTADTVAEDLRSDDHSVVFKAIISSLRLGERAREIVPDLVRLAAVHEKSGVRQFAITSLASIAPDNATVREVIFQALNDPVSFVRREALQALISVPNLSADELARIKDMERDPDSAVASWSEIALRNIRLRGQADPEMGPAVD
jgi:HEAT repeat protein